MKHPDDSTMTAISHGRHLYDAAAELFKVSKDGLSHDTRLADLGADEHSREELLMLFEDKLNANRTAKKAVVSFADLSGAETIGEILERIRDQPVGQPQWLMSFS